MCWGALPNAADSHAFAHLLVLDHQQIYKHVERTQQFGAELYISRRCHAAVKGELSKTARLMSRAEVRLRGHSSNRDN